jgi:sec-independent protein translocase protein TatB
MFNIGSGEIALIAVVALLVLGPKGLPELARGIGKFMREFRRQTDEVRGVVEREFYKMDQEVSIQDPPLAIRPAQDNVALGSGDPHLDPHADLHAGLPAAEHLDSQLTAGMPRSAPRRRPPRETEAPPPAAASTRSRPSSSPSSCRISTRGTPRAAAMPRFTARNSPSSACSTA